jgi:hypothetical protein
MPRMRLGTVVAIGWRAAQILEGGTGGARVLAPLAASIYVSVRGEMVWLGGPDAILHARAVLLSEHPEPGTCLDGTPLPVPDRAIQAWRPAPLPRDPASAAAFRSGSARLARHAASLGQPTGFGARLLGAPLAFPLTAATPLADALADACRGEAPERAAAAAVALLGLGAGLTPSGDDFVGGAFFARAALAHMSGDNADGWRRAAATIRTAAERATHPISAALLGDLLAGHGWKPMHDLVRALACGNDVAAADAARRLTRLGHSSGWDLLAGVLAGTAP